MAHLSLPEDSAGGMVSGHSAPPCAAKVVTTKARPRVPPPQGAEQAAQSENPPTQSTGQLAALQISCRGQDPDHNGLEHVL